MLAFAFILSLISNSLCVFGPEDKNYNETEALILFDIVASAHSINPQECFNRQFKNQNIKLIAHEVIRCDILASKCTFVIAEITDKKLIVIAFRGTETMSQFFFEGMSLFIPDQPFFGQGGVNYYFDTAHDWIWAFVWNYLKKFENHDVIFTGHSLGGSFATLSAFRTILEGIRNASQVKLVTFAEPRTGNFKFAKNIDKTIKYKFRIVNRSDVLARTPPCHKDLRFAPNRNLPCDHRSRTGPYHHMPEIWYPNGMDPGSKYVVCDGVEGEDPFCSSSVLITLENFGRAITDHRKCFGVMIGQYGRAGCDRSREFSESEGFLGMLKYISEFLNKFF